MIPPVEKAAVLLSADKHRDFLATVAARTTTTVVKRVPVVCIQWSLNSTAVEVSV